MPKNELSQRGYQKQTQFMGQHQLRSLRLLALDSQSLTEEIQKAVEENPALVIVREGQREQNTNATSYNKEGSKIDGTLALEAKADERESLQDHLLSQLAMSQMGESEKELCERLVQNLDERGFHILAPISLLDRKDKNQTPGLLEKCIKRLHSLDPCGVCVANTEESLLVQAQEKGDAPPLALFILDGHFSLLDPPRSERISHKVKELLSERKKLFALPSNDKYSSLDTSLEAAEEALSFIKTLDPLPARNYSIKETKFVSPDVYVEKDETIDKTKTEEDLVVAEDGTSFRVWTSQNKLPQVKVSHEFEVLAKKKDEGLDKIKEQVRLAHEFVSMLEYRESTVLKATKEIVRLQSKFFTLGQGHLLPLKQKDIAYLLGVAESTVSRMANSKFLQCEWGLFNIKYFFSPAAGKKDLSTSREKAMAELKKILENNPKKKMSDRELCDELEKLGIRISRRTVAKYRSFLSIGSSYER